MRRLFSKEKLILLLVVLVFLNIGCESSMRTYLKEEAPLHKIRKLAIIPFDNSSKDKNAGDKLIFIFAIELLTSKQFNVVEPGEVERALKEVKVRAKGGVSTIETADVQKIGEALGVDAVILGTIDTFETGKKDDPLISMNIRMLDTKDGSLIWSVDYTATGSSFAYFLDFGKVNSLNMLARKVVKEVLSPLIKKSKNSLRDAKVKIENAKKVLDKAEGLAKDLKTKAEDLEIQAKESEEKAKDLESRAKQAENEALKINPDALAREINILQEGIKDAENKLATLTANAKKKVTIKTDIESKLKEVESEAKGHKDKLDEITAQINIYQAKQRVEAIRGNQEGADSFKKKADEAKTQADAAQGSYDNAKKSLDALTKDLDGITPDVKKAQDEERVASDKVESLKASLAQITKMQKELPENIGPEQIAAAKKAEAEAKTIRGEANKANADAKRLRDMADQVKKQADKAVQEADLAKKNYEDIRTKLE